MASAHAQVDMIEAPSREARVSDAQVDILEAPPPRLSRGGRGGGHHLCEGSDLVCQFIQDIAAPTGKGEEM